MEMHVVEHASNKLIVKITGTDHTLLNVLVKELQKDKHVVAAAYAFDHPESKEPKLVIQTEGKAAPKAVLQDAIKNLKKEYTQFGVSFKKAFA